MVHPSPCPSQQDVQIENNVFLAYTSPPAHPNTNPHCNHLAFCTPNLPSIISPLNRDTWEYHLADYQDHEFINVLLNIMYEGCQLATWAHQNISHAII